MSQNPYDSPIEKSTSQPAVRNYDSAHDAYWKKSLNIVYVVLGIWAFISLGCGILFRDFLDAWHVGHAPLGFWMAQQGAIIGFLILLFVYMLSMNVLDRRHGFGEDDAS